MDSLHERRQRLFDRDELLKALRALERGDFTVRMPAGLSGVDGEIARLFNAVVELEQAKAAEIARVAHQVGKEGQIGARMHLAEATGDWAKVIESMNSLLSDMAFPMTEVARVIGSVAKGDLSHTMVLDDEGRPLRGEALRLGTVVNTMVGQLNAFSGEVSRVAREVGTEGKLGGQAQVAGVAGTWRELTENVNRLAANLTTQVRAIAEVATAVTKGDLTRSVTVEALGEVASLKDNINEMIRNLKDTTRKNTEQDWLKTHLARFTRMLQGHRDLVAVSRLILSELTPLVNAQQAAFYVADHRGDSQLELLAGYARRPGKELPRRIAFGEGLVGQCALERKRILISQAPGDYIPIGSALGASAPASIIILPVLFEGQVKAVIELASFGRFSETHQAFLDQLTESIGVVLHTIAANMQTEYLLQQSQTLTAELQSQQEEMTKTNALLKSKQDELSSANAQLQDKAHELSEQSRYKSEFLANMSHELRTPLNSLLILARLLTDNVGGNLTTKQVEFARTIHASGAELLALINDILDLAKIESGTVTLNIGAERFASLAASAERAFRQVAADKGLEFRVELDPRLPPALRTDVKRLQQVLSNLLSNAFKFTAQGKVELRIEPAAEGWSAGHPELDRAAAVIALSVIDTGIGIPPDKQRLIFEAFQQADGGTSREYGGTGLGLSISRELARLLGGEIRVASTPARGSTFTLYLPLDYRPADDVLAAADSPWVEAPAARYDAEVPLVAALPPVSARALAGRKVLVVDDDIRNVFALTSALEQYGLEVLHADSGREGVELLKHTRGVDLVLMDMMMPGLDGLDTMRLVREIDGYRDVPVIAVTAKAMVGDREKCLAAGASDYVAKPVSVDLLLGTLSNALSSSAAR